MDDGRMDGWPTDGWMERIISSRRPLLYMMYQSSTFIDIHPKFSTTLIIHGMVVSIAKSFQNVLYFVSMPKKLRGLLSLLVHPH
jgi:hypothetical protein